MSEGKATGQKEASGVERRETPRNPRPQKAVLAEASSCLKVIPTTEVRFLLNVRDKVWAAEREGPITVRNGLTGEVEATITTVGANFCWCLLACEGLVWAGYSGGQIRVYHAENYAFVKELHQHAGGVYALTYSNGHVYSGSNDFECFRWHARRFEFLRQFSGHRNSVRCIVAFAATLITGSDDHTIRIWDLLTGELYREITGHRGGVLALLRDGSRLWSSSDDGTVRVWNWETGEQLHCISDHTGRATGLSQVDHRIYSIGVDRTIYCYHNQTYKRLGRFHEHEGYINHLAPIGYSVQYHAWTCSNDKTIRVWNFEAPFRYASEDPSSREDSAVALNQALDDQCLDLERRLKAAESDRDNERQQAAAEWDAERKTMAAELATAHDKVARLRIEAEAREAALQDAERRCAEERNAVAAAQRIAKQLQQQAEEDEAAAARLKAEQSAMEDQHREALERCRQEREGQEHFTAELRSAVFRAEEEAAALRRTLEERDATMNELRARCQSAKAHLDAGVVAMAELKAQNKQLAAELAQKAAELTRALGAEGGAHKAAAQNAAQVKALTEQLAAEHGRSAELQRELQEAQQRAAHQQNMQKALEEQLRQHEALSQGALQNAVGLENQLKALEAERMEIVKKESEFEFVLQSRSELVRQIWELYCDLGDSKKGFRELLLTPTFKQCTAIRDQQKADNVISGLTAAKDRNRRIICNYFTEVEKHHVGASPYFFPPDEDSGRYRIMENNLEALRRLGMHDLRRTAILTAVRDKAGGPTKQRNNATPVGRQDSDVLQRIDPEPEGLTEVRPPPPRSASPARPLRPASPARLPTGSPVTKGRVGGFRTPIRDKAGSRSRSPRL